MKNIILLSLVSLVVTSCGLFDSGSPLDPTLIPVKSGEKYGFIGTDGKIEINPQFEYAYFFTEEKMALVMQNKKYGFISKEGQMVIQPVYITANSFSEGLACVVPENGKPQFINTKNEVIIPGLDVDYCSSFQDGLALIGKVDDKDKRLFGFIDKKGSIVVPATFAEALAFSEGRAAVRKDTKGSEEGTWGYIDQKGTLVITHQFKSAGSFHEGFAVVGDGKKYGYINEDGKYVINLQFEEAGPFQNGLAVIKQGEKYGYINAEGKLAINPQFTAAYPFSDNDLALVMNDDKKYGFINKEGKYVINPQFEAAVPFVADYAMVFNGQKGGLIDKEGRYLINPQYDGFSVSGQLYRNKIVVTPLPVILLGLNDVLRSDYIDLPGVTKKIMDLFQAKKILDLDTTVILGSIMTAFTERDNSSQLYVYKPYCDTLVARGITVREFEFTFDGPVYREVPRYKTESYYNYYYGGYSNRQVFDSWEKQYQPDAPLKLLAVTISLSENAYSKGALLSRQLGSDMAKYSKYQTVDLASAIPDPQDPDKELVCYRNSRSVLVVMGEKGEVTVALGYGASKLDEYIKYIKEFAAKYLKKEDVDQPSPGMKTEYDEDLSSYEYRRVADSIAMADSLAMVQAVQQAIADSIAAAHAARRY